MPKVTALVSAYYAADTIEGRLRNLFSLTPVPEVIVVCHAGSEEDEVAHMFDALILCTPDVPTLYKAWNMAIDVAKGEYLTSANCDDRLYQWGYTGMIGYLDHRPDCALVHGDCDRQEGTKVMPWKRQGPSVSIGHCVVGPMPMWRRTLHNSYGMFDEKMTVAGDFDYWLRIQNAGERIDYLDFAVGLYRARQDSLEHRNRIEHSKELNTILERHGHGAHRMVTN